MATRMNDAEAIMWAVESDPFLRSDFMNITLLESSPDPVRLRAGIDRTLTAFPPLRQRVVRPPLGIAPPEWADDPEFDLGYHFRRVAVPPPGGHRALLDLAALLASTRRSTGLGPCGSSRWWRVSSTAGRRSSNASTTA